MVRRKIIEINEEKCTGCGQCVVNCAEGALEIVNGKAHVVNEHFCDGLGACIGECPAGALKIVEREAPEFNEAAVLEHLLQRKSHETSAPDQSPISCACPSAAPLVWNKAPLQKDAGTLPSLHSEVRQWPLKLRLVPPFAPYFQDMTRLVVISDCASLAYPAVHMDFLREEGTSLVQVCPKFENPHEIASKLAGIIQYAGKLRDILVIEMEVPCCKHLLHSVREALIQARHNNQIYVEEAIISYKGTLLSMRNYEPTTSSLA